MSKTEKVVLGIIGAYVVAAVAMAVFDEGPTPEEIAAEQATAEREAHNDRMRALQRQEAAERERARAEADRKARTVTVTAKELSRECAANEVRFVNAYKGKIIVVTGKVDRIDDGVFGTTVFLRGRNAFDSVLIGGIDDTAAARLNKGDVVTFTCEGVGEVLGSASLSDCR